MSQALCFNEVRFSPLDRDGQPWFRSSEIARALGYVREDTISRLYDRNADEFTENMTQVVENIDTVNLTVRVRIFSLRGCHLLAMFARTPVAKAFRKWVLDVIEKYGDRVPIEQHAFIPTPSTPADRKPLRSLVNAWAKLANVHPSTLWPQVRAHFQLERIDDLPVEWLPDALAWVQSKIDEVNGKPLKEEVLPPAPFFDEAPLLELAEDIRRFQQAYCRSYGLLFARLYQAGASIMVCLEQRATQKKELAPFSDMTIHGQFDRFLSDRLIGSLSSLAEPLPDRENPAMLLLACARAMNA